MGCMYEYIISERNNMENIDKEAIKIAIKESEINKENNYKKGRTIWCMYCKK